MNKIKNQLRRAFTIVELIVVIAVIAALAAILIPTFMNVVNSANESSDISMIYNINLALTTEQNEIKTVSDALEVAAEAGYNIDKLTPSSDGEIVYDHNTKSFALISTEGEVIYPTSNSSLDLNAPTTYYFVDETAYTALNEASALTPSYSVVKSVKTATDTGTTNQKEHTASYVATGDWEGEFNYTGMGAIDTTRAKGITKVSYTSQKATSNDKYKSDYDGLMNVSYYINYDTTDLTIEITQSGNYTIYTSVASNVVYKISIAEGSTVNIVEANENAAPMIRQDTNSGVTLTISINGTDVTEDYVVEENENAVVENGALQLGIEKYPWLIASESDLTKINNGGYCKVSSDEVTSSSALTVDSTTEAILDLNGCTLTISGTSNSSNIVNNGTLTITDSSTAKNGKLVVNTATYGIYNNGTLTVEGGTIEGQKVIYLNNSSASLYMTGGTITGTSTKGIYAQNCNNLIITGGEISATGSYSYALQISSYSGTVAISGVTITGAKNGIDLTIGSTDVTIENVTVKDCSSIGIAVNAFGTEEGKVYINNNCTVTTTDYALSLSGNVTVDSGTYTSSGSYALYVFNDNSNVTVNSGTFTGTNGAAYTGNGNSCTLIISGGTLTGEIKAGKKTTINISGGTVNGNITLVGSSTTYGTMTISGGSFDGTLTVGTNCSLTITGGKFTNDPSSYVDKDNYTVSESSSTKYKYTITKNI